LRTAAADTLFEFYKACGNVHAQLTQRAEASLPHRLSMAQFGVLDALRDSLSPQTPLALAHCFSLTKGAITNLLKQLEKKGFIELQTHPGDGRSKLVSLSAAGNAAHRASLLALWQMTSQVLDEFPQFEIENVLPSIKRLQGWLQKP